MKSSRLEQMKKQLKNKYPQDKAQRLADNMQREFDELCKRDSIVEKQMIKHTHNNIYPVAAAYKALMTEGMDREEAAKLAGDTFLELMEQGPARAIKKAMKLPGLYRTMPWLWKTLMPRLFSPDAGFKFKFYPTDKTQVKFDMTGCPYYKVCLDIGCKELAPIFCASDDICYGNMHPKLIWNRSKTIARGADICDFDLYIKK